MNKTELTEKIADTASISKTDAGKALDCVISSITKELKAGRSVTLVGFGTFSVRSRKARTGVNPMTKEQIKIKASKTAAFKPGKALKDTLN